MPTALPDLGRAAQQLQQTEHTQLTLGQSLLLSQEWGQGKEAARSLSFPREGEGNKTQEEGSGKGKTHLPWMVLLQLGSQQPLAEDTPGSSQQLLKWDKNPSR